MRIKDIMTKNVVAIGPATYLEEAARLMKDHDIGMLPVMKDDVVLGVITDRDIVTRALAQRWNPLLTQARVIMSEKLVWCFDDVGIDQAARLMANTQVHRLLVFNREMILVGIVSLDDLAVALRDERTIGKLLRDVTCLTVAHHAAA